MALWLFLGIAIPSLIISVLLPNILHPKEREMRIECAINLRQIGQAIMLHGIDYHGQYPDSFATLLLNEDITSAVFVCPDSNDTPAAGPTTQAVAANLSVPGHYSYIYIGSGFNTATVAPNAVVAYEPISNHGSAGTPVLFGDGHVAWVTASTAAQITARVSAHAFPVTMPATP